MGYTVTYRPQNKEVADLLIEFMEIERLKSKILERVYPTLCKAKDLSYCNKRGHIGFDYHGGIDRELAYVIIHWLVRATGKEDFYYYDGEKSELSDERFENGVKKDGYEEFKSLGWDVDFQEEITRLQTAWFHFYLQKKVKGPYDTGGYVQ